MVWNEFASKGGNKGFLLGKKTPRVTIFRMSGCMSKNCHTLTVLLVDAKEEPFFTHLLCHVLALMDQELKHIEYSLRFSVLNHLPLQVFIIRDKTHPQVDATLLRLLLSWHSPRKVFLLQFPIHLQVDAPFLGNTDISLGWRETLWLNQLHFC